MIRLILTWLAVLAAALPGLARADPQLPEVRARLVVASDSPAPGHDLAVGIAIDPGPGWHIYWQNPGESGYAPRFTWHLPAGYAMGDVRHPAPQRLVSAGMTINAHAGPVMLLTRLTVPGSARVGDRITIAGQGDLLVCSDSMCVPRVIDLTRPLVIGTGQTVPAAVAMLDVASQRLPKVLPGPITYAVAGHVLRLHGSLPGPAPGEVPAIFAAGDNAGTPGSARFAEDEPDTLVVDQGALQLAPELDLVLTLARPGQLPMRAYRIHAARAAPPASSGASGWLAAGAIGGAMLGGLLLNLMPCVFPILSLKAMALIRAGGDRREARSEALGYLAGAVGVMLALGGAVLLLRAGGSTAGWAFQLQDPRVVGVLLVLVLAIATNLAGLFELPSLGIAMPARGGFAGGVGTGALAAFIATPCTGPFMAGALGAALVLPAGLALLVFAALGMGLALPFVVVGFVEPARRLLPRPGNWMVTLRRLLSLPMFATALGLAWLLGQQAGVSGMTGGLGVALLAGLALWWTGLRQRAGRSAGLAIGTAGLAVLALPLVVPAHANGHITDAAQRAGEPQAYSPARLASLREQHHPVLLYATADWCLTCKVNEATSLSPDGVRKAFASAGAVMLAADWTRSDPQVSQLLAENGRAGVPLYIWYPEHGNPRVLPQVLTPGLVIGLVATPART